MKKLSNWMLTSCRANSRSTKQASSLRARSIAVLAAILICGASVFTSCSSNEDNTVVPVEPDLNLAEKIIGKWIVADLDGEPCPTDLKAVVTFVSPTKAYGNLSDILSDSWNDEAEADVNIKGNSITMVSEEDEHIKHVLNATVSSITDQEMVLRSDWTIFLDGEIIFHEVYDEERWVRVTDDYEDAVIGVWEGKINSEHRWEYKADGTYVYYNKDGDNWVPSANTLNEYFVAGNLLCMRWINDDQMYHEWWEIESIEDGVMKLTALRVNDDGTTYNATFEMKKGDVPTQEELEQKLVGKWLYWGYDGQQIAETGESSVTTFVMEGSTLKAYITQSLQKYDLWVHNQPAEVKIDGNKVTVTMQSGNTTTVEEMTDIRVDEDELAYTSKFTVYKDGEVVDDMVYQLYCSKSTDDYSQIILGRWEGTITSDEPGFEPQPFCEEYFSNGTNVEYELIDGQWVEMETEYAEYFIDGNLLLTRWKYPGKEEERENSLIISYKDDTLIVKEAVVSDGKISIKTNTLKKVQVSNVR